MSPMPITARKAAEKALFPGLFFKTSQLTKGVQAT